MKAMVRVLLLLGKLYYFFKMETSISCHEFWAASDDKSYISFSGKRLIMSYTYVWLAESRTRGFNDYILRQKKECFIDKTNWKHILILRNLKSDIKQILSVLNLLKGWNIFNRQKIHCPISLAVKISSFTTWIYFNIRTHRRLIFVLWLCEKFVFINGNLYR